MERNLLLVCPFLTSATTLTSLIRTSGNSSLPETHKENNKAVAEKNKRVKVAAGKNKKAAADGREAEANITRPATSSNGFDEQILAEAFNVDAETVRKLQGQNDDRGRIVRVERGLDLVVPEREEEEEERRHQVGYNGLEETICTLKLRENIADSRRADVFNPRGGRNAILAPHWNMNAHSVIYVIRGSGRLQIVGNGGRSVFNDRVQEGQLITVPQNFAVVKRAGEQGLEWVAFKTNDNAMTSPLAGRLSVLRAMPEEVLMNSYAISREDARNVKYNRDELTVFGPGSRSRERV
ncbi:hypothetical protein F0562_000498 [Nyssa sinensis]|uniref:Cupin type-1 domain-containing protein n=1 Tax=Nyssa sinensis TaxID=561372 RepID=A0A5J5C1U4_9ASTE|nr:hypothetical protein F0562_000498 [Nyssa sinensis]